MAAQHALGPSARAQALRRNRAQEYSSGERKLVGERSLIFEGTPLGFTEAPHLYKRDGWYYLITAEGGTGGITRSRWRGRAICSGPTSCIRTRHILSAATGPTRRCSAPAMPIWSRRRTARPGWSICAAVRCPIAAAACWAARRRSSKCVGARMAGSTRSTATACPIEVAAPSAGRIRFRRRRSARFRDARPADRLPMAAHALARAIFSLTARPGPSAPLRPRDDRQPVHPGLVARRQQAFLLFGGDVDGVRSGPFPAGGGPGLLLRRRQIPLSPHVA